VLGGCYSAPGQAVVLGRHHVLVPSSFARKVHVAASQDGLPGRMNSCCRHRWPEVAWSGGVAVVVFDWAHFLQEGPFVLALRARLMSQQSALHGVRSIEVVDDYDRRRSLTCCMKAGLQRLSPRLAHGKREKTNA
jgi:hypothetical protein